jgi:hypothetical protein
VEFTYKGADRDACCDGGNGAGAHVACNAATCGEGTEDETDGVERSLGRWLAVLLSSTV